MHARTTWLDTFPIYNIFLFSLVWCSLRKYSLSSSLTDLNVLNVFRQFVILVKQFYHTIKNSNLTHFKYKFCYWPIRNMTNSVQERFLQLIYSMLFQYKVPPELNVSEKNLNFTTNVRICWLSEQTLRRF